MSKSNDRITRRESLARIGGTFAAISTGSVLWGGCGGGPGRPADSTLRIPIQNEPETLEPAHGEKADELFVMDLLYDSLLLYDGEMNILPNLARDLPEQPDETTYIFELREGLTFHNGDPVTAEDVVYSFEWILEEKTIKYANFQDIDAVTAEDTHTVRFDLARPFAPFLDFLASAGRSVKIVNSKLREKTGATSTTLSADPTGAGTGPFKFVAWNSGQNLILERNQDYHLSGVPGTQRVELPIISEPSSQILDFRTQKLDILYKIPIKDFVDLSKSGEFESRTTTSLEIEHVYLNITEPPFSDRNLRLAVAHAINRKEILKRVFYNEGVVAEGPWLPGDYFHNPEVESIVRYDPEKAREYLKKAGRPDGFSFDLTVTNSSWFPAQAKLIQSQLARVNITANIELLDKASNYSRLYSANFDASLEDTVSRIPHPDNMLYRHFHTDGSLNSKISRFQNDRVDELLSMARRTTDREEQRTYYFEAQRIITEQQPYIFLVYRPAMGVWHPYVENYHVVPTSMPVLRWVSLQQEA